MGLKTEKILGINVTVSSKTDILEEIQKYLGKAESGKRKAERNGEKPVVIFTPNPEIITCGQQDGEFKRIVNTAQINLPDGAGVVWAMKKLYGLKIEKIAGVDFMMELVNLTEKEGFLIGLIGGRGDLADRTAECLVSNYPNLKIEAFDAPEIEIKNEKLKIKNYENKKAINTPRERSYFTFFADEIKKKKIDILFVALGHPKQEYFIHELVRSWLLVHSERTNQLTMNPIVLMSVGGAFDYISGRVPRAPLWVRNIGLEWLFRLIREPWRFPRQLKGTEFFLRVLNSTSGLERGQK